MSETVCGWLYFTVRVVLLCDTLYTVTDILKSPRGLIPKSNVIYFRIIILWNYIEIFHLWKVEISKAVTPHAIRIQHLNIYSHEWNAVISSVISCSANNSEIRHGLWAETFQLLAFNAPALSHSNSIFCRLKHLNRMAYDVTATSKDISGPRQERWY